MNTTTHTTTTLVNWAEVKSYYLDNGSYAATARHFGIKADAVRKRCARYGWEQEEADKTGQMRTESGQRVSATDKYSAICPQSGHAQADKNRTNADNITAVCPGSGQAHEDASGQNELPAIPASFPELPCLPNLTAHEMTFRKPWEVSVIAHSILRDKEAYRAYIQRANTQDCLVSGVLGEIPSRRVGRENPPARMLAVIADYDIPLSYDKREAMLARLPIRPNFISTSYSGGTHAVWFFEKPLPLPHTVNARDRLLATIRKKLKLDRAFGALDAGAFERLSQVYHAGWDWRMVNESPIPEESSLVWLMDAIAKDSPAAELPLSIVAAEVERRFPGRWSGDFIEGARGVRFWDSQADNQTAAIVTPTGMLCFTGPRSFMSWADIFGPDFLERCREDKFGKVLKECFEANNMFYVRGDFHGIPCWRSYNRPNLESLLSKRYGLRVRAARGEEQSEVKEAVATILRMNSVYAARPFIYNRETVIISDGKPVLNTSLLSVHMPDEDKGKFWGDGFPWTAAFLDSLFPDLNQREHFMSEWAYAYRHAFAGKPKNGRVTFIAGDAGVGKNFLTECLIGPSMGGYVDPSSYLLGQTRFNDSLFDVGVWVCNDTVAKGDVREHQLFTASLKRMAANMTHNWEGKFKGACKIEWSGRVYITLNTDPVSMQILPDLDQSNRDKISLYKVSGPPLNDVHAAEKARAELGALCAYLLNMEYPIQCRDGARWGVKNYLHEELYIEAVNSSYTASFAEILSLYCKDRFDADPSCERLQDNATGFLRMMMEQSSLKEMLRGSQTPVSFGRRMAALANTGTFPLRHVRGHDSRQWVVERKEFEQYLKTGCLIAPVDDLFAF